MRHRVAEDLRHEASAPHWVDFRGSGLHPKDQNINLKHSCARAWKEPPTDSNTMQADHVPIALWAPSLRQNNRFAAGMGAGRRCLFLPCQRLYEDIRTRPEVRLANDCFLQA